MDREDRMETGDLDFKTRDFSRGVSRMVRIEDRDSIKMIIAMIDLSKGFEKEVIEDVSQKD